MESLPDVLDEKGEPKIEYTPQPVDFSDVLDQPISLDESDQMNMCEIQKNLIQYDLNDYLLKEQPTSLPEQQRVKEEWLAKKQKKLDEKTSLLKPKISVSSLSSSPSFFINILVGFPSCLNNLMSYP